MASEIPDFQTMLTVLAQHAVDYIVVGGVSAALQGAPVQTFDLDIVPSRDAANVERLMRALQDLEAFYRERPDIRIAPTARHLSGSGHHLLMTRLGPLDVLGTIGDGEGYGELLGRTRPMEIAAGVSVPILDLEALIRLREALARDKDKAVLPILRRTLEERRRNGGR